MIISPGRNYIFVHIPKTGGTSLATALEARAMADDILIGDTPKAQRRKRRLQGAQSAGRLWKHSTLRDIAGLVSDDFIAGATVFTLVRNPWDRMVSYYHWLREQSFDHPAVALSQRHTFSGFLRHPSTAAALRRTPYRSYVTDQAGVMRASHFIRLEHLAADLAPVQAKLGLALEIPHINASTRTGTYQSHYSDSDSSYLADICAEDIEFFGYMFNKP